MASSLFHFMLDNFSYVNSILTLNLRQIYHYGYFHGTCLLWFHLFSLFLHLNYPIFLDLVYNKTNEMHTNFIISNKYFCF